MKKVEQQVTGTGAYLEGEGGGVSPALFRKLEKVH